MLARLKDWKFWLGMVLVALQAIVPLFALPGDAVTTINTVLGFLILATGVKMPTQPGPPELK